MRKIFKILNKSLVLFGIDFKKCICAISELPLYIRNWKILRKQEVSADKRFPFRKPYPCFGDRNNKSGIANGHYFHQDLLVAKRIYKNRPNIHFDVGSRIDGFVAHVASFRNINVVDIRSSTSSVGNIKFMQANLMEPIEDHLINCCDSLSCLHTLEHFGLGRYGDPVDYEGYLKGLNNLYQMLKSGGKFYLSVPIGPQRIEFDAHRVFSMHYLLELFKDKYTIDNFSFVDDSGALQENVPLEESLVSVNFKCNFGCGIFEMTKI